MCMISDQSLPFNTIMLNDIVTGYTIYDIADGVVSHNTL